jgi:hypothetical protein
MKTRLLSIAAVMAISPVFAQFSTVWPLSTNSNATSAGYVGLGTKTTSTATTLPSFNFHIHSVTDWYDSGTPGGPGPVEGGGGGTPPVNRGVTSRIGLTNSLTGTTQSDGAVLRMSTYNLTLENQEKSDLLLASGDSRLVLNGVSGRVGIGFQASNTSTQFAKLNVKTLENGLHVQTDVLGKYGLTVQIKGNSDNAINVYSNNNTTVANFRVKGSGEVFARKYTTTLAAFPDYVFDDNYALLSFQELRAYLNTNNRLPNMPSAAQVEKEGADLGELNRLLVEKVEELTLYILQLEERMQKVENAK